MRRNLTLDIPAIPEGQGPGSDFGFGESYTGAADDHDSQATSTVNGVPPTPQRTQSVFVRSRPEVGAMSSWDRTKIQMRAVMNNFVCCRDTSKKVRVRSNSIVDAKSPISQRLQEAMEQGVRADLSSRFDSKRKAYSSGGDDNSGDNDDNDEGRDDRDDDDDDEDDDSALDDAPPVQFRLEATSHGPRVGFFQSMTSCCSGNLTASGALSIGENPNQRLAIYLHWVFRVNFIFLFVVMCTCFFFLVTIFAGFIIWAGRMDEECVLVGGNNIGHTGNEFADAFGLSWTTFSTVGYGSTYPSLGNENDNPSHCLFITIVCSLESFLGVLYSGFCGAILFGKVLRIQSHAQVLFSDPIVIRYGSGVMHGNTKVNAQSDEDSKLENGSAESGASGEDDTNQQLLCPVLEFRVVNRLYGEVGGEIMDATLNVVANVDANDTDPRFRKAVESGQLLPFNSRSHSAPGSIIDTSSDYSDSNRTWSYSEGAAPSMFINRLGALGARFSHRRDHHSIIEDPSSRFVSKRLFSKMMIEASDHPFFKRVWLARHTLNDSSPILKPKIRRMIRRNQGFWPNQLNSHDAVRDALQFNQILVSLNGVSNVSASDVYAQKIYDFVDINIGYQFVNILYRDPDGSLKVDTDLINDVREQDGGGGEPLLSD